MSSGQRKTEILVQKQVGSPRAYQRIKCKKITYFLDRKASIIGKTLLKTHAIIFSAIKQDIKFLEVNIIKRKGLTRVDLLVSSLHYICKCSELIRELTDL